MYNGLWSHFPVNYFSILDWSCFSHFLLLTCATTTRILCHKLSPFDHSWRWGLWWEHRVAIGLWCPVLLLHSTCWEFSITSFYLGLSRNAPCAKCQKGVELNFFPWNWPCCFSHPSLTFPLPSWTMLTCHFLFYFHFYEVCFLRSPSPCSFYPNLYVYILSL